jgi:Kef-type K+ transport system membrane component KefB
MIVVGVFLFRAIQEGGRDLKPGVNLEATGVAAVHTQINALLHVLLALAVVIIMARIMGALFKLFHQPAVIGEVIGGICLGPSLLGRIAPELSAFILPHAAAPFLGIISQLGVIFYMFLVGLELDLRVLRRSGHATLAISHASIIVPFVLGAALALKLYPEVGTSGVGFTPFALFLGVSMSITAFPVLARILTDRKISKSRMGTVALTCAAVDDVTAWCLLAFVVSIVQAKVGSAVITLVLTLGFIAFMFVVARPAIAKLVPILETFDRITEGGMALIFVAILVCSLITEAIGIHAIFGAFLLGAVTPSNSRVAREVTERLEDLVRVVFLPAFFAFTGLRTQVGLLNTFEDWKLCGLIILVATIGKFGGSFAAARLTGLNSRDAAGLGILMNTRGLVELIVLNIGLDLKVLSPTLFTMLVIMALVTTFMTTPFFHFITRRHPWVEEERHRDLAPRIQLPV